AGGHFVLNFARESLPVSEAAHFRVALADDEATIAVFKGKLNATSPAGQVEVAEKHSAAVELANDDAAKKDTFAIAKNYEAEPSDAWERRQTDYHERY